MTQAYLSWPTTLYRAYHESLSEIRLHGYEPWEAAERARTVIGCGMGGSGYSIEIAFRLLDEVYPRHPKIVNRRPNPPCYASPRDFVVAVSYSGETLETIECARGAMVRGVPVAAVAPRGSSLFRLVSGKGAVASVERGGLPRASLGELVGRQLAVLGGDHVRDLVRRVTAGVSLERVQSVASMVVEALVEDREPSYPLVISCGVGESVAVRWVDELAENAKLFSIYEVYPEAGHNKVVRWSSGAPARFTAFYIATTEPPICRGLTDFILERYGREMDVYVIDEWAREGVALPVMLLEAAMAIGVASVRIAELRGVDPGPTPPIRDYKRALRGIIKTGALEWRRLAGSRSQAPSQGQ